MYFALIEDLEQIFGLHKGWPLGHFPEVLRRGGYKARVLTKRDGRVGQNSEEFTSKTRDLSSEVRDKVHFQLPCNKAEHFSATATVAAAMWVLRISGKMLESEIRKPSTP